LSGLEERAGSARSATTVQIAIIGPFFFPQLDGVEKVMLNHARHLARRGAGQPP
jgi:hypothetical protein